VYCKDHFIFLIREYIALCIQQTKERKFIKEKCYQFFGLISDQRKMNFEILASGFCSERGLFGTHMQFPKNILCLGVTRGSLNYVFAECKIKKRQCVLLVCYESL